MAKDSDAGTELGRLFQEGTFHENVCEIDVVSLWDEQ